MYGYGLRPAAHPQPHTRQHAAVPVWADTETRRETQTGRQAGSPPPPRSPNARRGIKINMVLHAEFARPRAVHTHQQRPQAVHETHRAARRSCMGWCVHPDRRRLGRLLCAWAIHSRPKPMTVACLSTAASIRKRPRVQLPCDHSRVGQRRGGVNQSARRQLSAK